MKSGRPSYISSPYRGKLLLHFLTLQGELEGGPFLDRGGEGTRQSNWKSFESLNCKKIISMTKKETLKWTLQILASIISAVLTALGATSCVN